MNGLRVTSRFRSLTLRVGRHLAKTPDSESQATRASLGFTLIELLVVVTVLLILTVMTISTIDFTFMSERVKAGSRQVQSALAGARDRAIFAKEPRGLRFLVDPNDPRIVTSMIYVGPPSKNWTEGKIQLEWLIEDANGNGTLDAGEDQIPNGLVDPPTVAIVHGLDAAWDTLKDRGFLGVDEDVNGNNILDAGEDQNNNGVMDYDTPRIRIPAGKEGTWYTARFNKLTSSNPILTLLFSDIPGDTPKVHGALAITGGGPSTYELKLPPRILPDTQPILLPEGVCIDLDGSDVPVEWRPTTPSVGVPFSVQYQIPYSAQMDLLFTPRGTVTDSVAAKGLVHLYVAERKDVQKTVDVGVLVGGTLTPRPPINGTMVPAIPGEKAFSPEEPIGQRLLLTVFTQTGKVSAHHIDATDNYINATGASGNDGYADTPFKYATQGEATSQ